jgi:phenol 2-monooxygenase
MPVFEETADERRDLRILPSRALPLPRLTPKTSSTDGEREVVVVGVSVQKIKLQ